MNKQVNSRSSFKTIGLVGRAGSELVEQSFKQLAEFIEARDRTLVIEDNSNHLLQNHAYQLANRHMMGEICDLVVVIGGDGTLLDAARDFSRYQVPVLGVNRGRLGFLTDISPHELETRMAEILAGEFSREKRFLLEAEVKRQGEKASYNSALNDVVFHSGNSVKMLEFELYIEGSFVYGQRSDGLIIATPTGSTAYALSGGGPIMHPRLDALVLVPMFPHTLSSRPIVVDGNSEIKILVGMANECDPILSCDGRGDFILKPGDCLYVRKRAHHLEMIHPLQHDFYESCRSKLGWSESL